jgi:hypothetical protein
MGGLVKRAAAITGRFANSGAVAPGVAAACELLAMSAHMPPEVGKALGVAIGSAVGSVAEEMVDVGAKAWQYRIDNVERFADGVHASGMTLDKLITDAAENPKRLEVLIRVIEAAARSLDATKVTMLARLYAQTAHDDDQIDDVALLEEAIRHLERPHLRLMRALSAEPPGPPDTGVASRTPMAGWAEGDFLATHSSLKPTYHLTIARLQAVGFVRDRGPVMDDTNLVVSDEPVWVLTESGRAAARYLEDQHRAEGYSAAS